MTCPRVALVSLTPLATGGIETHLEQIVRGLKREVAFCVVGDIHPPLVDTLLAEGIPVELITASGKFDLGCVLALRRAFRRLGVRLVHTHDTRGGLLARIAGRSLGVDCIHTVHTPAFFLQERGFAVRLYQWAEGLLNRWATRTVVFVSPSIQELYARRGLVRPAQAVCIPNGLEPFWFEPGEPREERQDDMRFLYVGRLSPEKGVATLLRAFALVVKVVPEAQLEIIGEGPEGESLARLASELGCADRIHWRGLLSRQDVHRAMQRAQVFVLPSRFESMSYTLLEAMASGLACIATRVGGNADLLADGKSGLLVAPGDLQAMANAMRRLASSREQRDTLQRAARQTAERYSVNAMLERSRALYQALRPSDCPGDPVR